MLFLLVIALLNKKINNNNFLFLALQKLSL